MEIIIINFCTKAVKGQLAKRWHNKYIHDQRFNYKANFRQTGGLAVVTQIKMALFFLKKTLWPLLWMGFNCPKAIEPLRGGSSKKFLVLILSTLEGWKAELTLEPPSGFEHRTLRLRIQRLNHGTCTKLYLFVKILSHVYVDKTFGGTVSNWVLKFR